MTGSVQYGRGGQSAASAAANREKRTATIARALDRIAEVDPGLDRATIARTLFVYLDTSSSGKQPYTAEQVRRRLTTWWREAGRSLAGDPGIRDDPAV